MNQAENIIDLTPTINLREVDLDADARPTEWVIEDFAARGKVTMIAGVGGGGKSRLMMQWAVEAAGRNRVVIVDAENAQEIIQQRLAALPAVRSPWASNPRVFEAQGFDLDVELGYLEDLVSSGCDLLLLDSWVSLWDKSENSTRQVKRALDSIRGLAIKYRTAIVLIHHTTKEGEDYRGSSAIGGAVDATFLFTKSKTDKASRVLTCTKMRFAPEPEQHVFGSVNGRYIVSRHAEPDAPTPKPARAPKAAAPPRVPTVSEIMKLQERKLISKGEAQALLQKHHGIGRGRSWWRR